MQARVDPTCPDAQDQLNPTLIKENGHSASDVDAGARRTNSHVHCVTLGNDRPLHMESLSWPLATLVEGIKKSFVSDSRSSEGATPALFRDFSGLFLIGLSHL
jgi:hypothetical protein